MAHIYIYKLIKICNKWSHHQECILFIIIAQYTFGQIPKPKDMFNGDSNRNDRFHFFLA